MTKRYFEIEFDNNKRARDTDGDVVGDYSICIIGKRPPSIKEAEDFCKPDMKQTGYKYVVAVNEVDRLEARTFFDIEKENSFPIFE